MSQAHEEEQAILSQIYDPRYQQTMFLIEQAMRDVSALPDVPASYPNTYDTDLLRLIDSVPLE